MHIHNISDLVRNETQRDYANNNHAGQLITYLLHTDIQSNLVTFCCKTFVTVPVPVIEV